MRMKGRAVAAIGLGLVIISASLAACGSSESSGDEFPTGRFIREGTTDYGFVFTEDGRWTVFDGPTTIVRATYTVDGNVFTETSNDAGCATGKSFTYTFDGTHLHFAYVANPERDRCHGRRNDLDDVTYTLVE